MDNPKTVDPIFMNGCLNAIDMMRQARMEDGLIAMVLFEVRAAAICEVDLWLSLVKHENPIARPKPSDILRKMSGE